MRHMKNENAKRRTSYEPVFQLVAVMTFLPSTFLRCIAGTAPTGNAVLLKREAPGKRSRREVYARDVYVYKRMRK